MEVELKKTKITKSIVEQSLMGSYSLFWKLVPNFHEPLGWCVVDKKKTRKILIYDKIEKNIVTLPYVQIHGGVEVFEDRVQVSDGKGGWEFPTIKHLKIKFCDINNSVTFQEGITPGVDDVDKIFKSTKDFLALINQRGQIYI